MEARPKPLRDEFAAHLECSRTRLFGYIHTLVRNLADAEDVFQLVALALWRRFDTYDRERAFLPWALGVARLEALAWLRRRARDRLRFSDESMLLLLDAFAAFPAAEADDRQAALPGCVEKLPESDRQLLQECCLGDENVAEVAARLGRPAPSVHNSLRRIRHVLFECIERKLAPVAREAS
jgi:RNA polymerase sigma-70 factor (ECF subfamily)